MNLSPEWPKRLLYLTHRAAWPRDTGAKLRNWHLVHELAKHTKVTFLAFEDDSGDFRRPEARAAKEQFSLGLERVVTLVRGRPYTFDKLVKSVIGELPIPVLNYTTQEMCDTVARLCAQMKFDAVQVEGVHLAAYLPMLRAAESKPVLVCDWHNIESEVQRRYGENTNKLHIKVAARLAVAKLAWYEPRFARQFDAHVTCSERDKRLLLDLAPGSNVSAVDNGVDVASFAEVAAKNKAEPGVSKRIIMVGSMDYHANADGAAEFARGPWPRIFAQHPDWKFCVVGRSPPQSVKDLAALPGVEVTGSVPDVRPYYQGAIASVVPLRIGGGSRLKILESMAAGVPVVSTDLGAEGIPTDGDHIIVTPRVDGLADGVLSLTPERAATLAEGGLALVKRRYDWSVVGETLMKVYRDIAANRRA